MTKDVTITILGFQDYEGSDNDQISLITSGTLSWDMGGLHLRYEETEVTGMEGTVTTIDVQGERVTLMRTGSVCSQMVFEQGRRHHSLYGTPYGTMEIVISTARLLSTLTDRGGRLEIDYSIEIDHNLIGRNSFRISVQEAKA